MYLFMLFLGGGVLAATRAEFLLLDLIINATCRCHEHRTENENKL